MAVGKCAGHRNIIVKNRFVLDETSNDERENICYNVKKGMWSHRR